MFLTDDECTATVIGEKVILPCTYDGTRNLLSSNISAWWRTGTEEIFKGMWNQGQEETLNVSNCNRAQMFSLAPQTGDLSMMLKEVVPSDAKTYSLHASFDGENTSTVLCTVCLRVGGKSEDMCLNNINKITLHFFSALSQWFIYRLHNLSYHYESSFKYQVTYYLHYSHEKHIITILKQTHKAIIQCVQLLTITCASNPQQNEYFFLFNNERERKKDGAVLRNKRFLTDSDLLYTAHYSSPAIQREEAGQEDKTQFVCHSRGGYPKPILHWLINSTDKPPPGSVKTYEQPLQDSELFNITSIMTVSIDKHVPVTCAIENRILNETFSTVNCEYGVR